MKGLSFENWIIFINKYINILIDFKIKDKLFVIWIWLQNSKYTYLKNVF